MKERPILFNGEMVRAVLDGRKTQTRRVVKPQPVSAWRNFEVGGPMHFTAWPNTAYVGAFDDADSTVKILRCPYGEKGDHLWVRECFLQDVDGDGAILRTLYRADYDKSILGKGWKPSIHMPRWASRITLEVTGVRVERVQDISVDACIADGIHTLVPHGFDEYGDVNAYAAFRDLWDSINAKRGYGWDVNPWVWVVEFRRAA